MSLRAAWQYVHTWRRRARWPLKCAAFALVVAVVLFPRVWLLPVWVGRLHDLNRVLDPGHPRLAPLEARVRSESDPGNGLVTLAGPVERVVCEQLPYAHDWETWGVMDYLPTVDEAFARGREDCDGRAVVAASLLRRLGYEAWLVTDLKHMWVVARDGPPEARMEVELMSPGSGAKSLVGDETGTRASLPGALANLLSGLSFGVAVFPLGREVVIVAALCLLTLHPRSSGTRRVVGCLLLLIALGMVRTAGGLDEGARAGTLLANLGVIAAGCGWVTLAVKAGVARSRPAPPESSAGADAPRG